MQVEAGQHRALESEPRLIHKDVCIHKNVFGVLASTCLDRDARPAAPRAQEEREPAAVSREITWLLCDELTRIRSK